MCVMLSAHAQDSILLRDYQFVKQQSSWLTSNNAAGLTNYQTKNIAEAEAGLSYAKGGLIDYWQAPTVLQVNVRAEAFQRLSARTVVYGSISYDNFTGRDMAGSAFIDPTNKPFDIVEDSVTNKGRKHRDTYQLTGAIGVELWKGFAMGARLDYTSANYAKYKDLRHSNKLMDLKLSVGVMGHMLDQLTIGANYLYHRNTESLNFNTYGKIEKVYKSLVSYAAFMGRLEQFGTTGYTEKGRDMPLVEDQHGGSLQIEWYPSTQWSFFNEVSLAHGTGYYGRKSPYTITFTNHDRDLLSYHGSLCYHRASTVLRLDVNLSSEKLSNNAETYRELTNENGAHYYEYYTPVKTGNKLWKKGQIILTANLGVKNEIPTWTLVAGVHRMNHKQTAYLYPFYRRQDLNQTKGMINVTRNLVGSKGIWSFSLSTAYQKGSGEPFEDLTFATPSEKQPLPPTMPAWLYQEYRYLTAGQYAVGADVKYSFVWPKTRISTFVKGAFDYSTSNTSNEYIESDNRLRLSLSIGCLF
jgi:hypothetical protein